MLVRTFSAFFRSPISLSAARYSSTMVGSHPVATTDRLRALRDLMAKPEYNVSALVIPTDDQRK